MSLQPHRRQAASIGFAATIGNMIGLNAVIIATFGIFLVPVAAEFGWARSTVSGVLGLDAILSALAYPLVGRFMDRRGARRALIAGNIVFGALVASLAWTNGNPWLFYLHFACIGLAGTVVSTAMLSKVVAEWFDARRGLALGITTGIGNGVGGTIIPLIAGTLIPIVGWRHTYAALGAIVVLVGFPIFFAFLRDAPQSAPTTDAATGAVTGGTMPVREGMTLREASRTPAFWLMIPAIGIGCGGMTAVFTHVVPMLTDRGVTLESATQVVVAFALTCAAWQVVTGALLDRLRTLRIVIPMYAAAILGLYWIQFGVGQPTRLAGGILLGIGMGAEFAALPYFVARYFGLRHYGSILGAFYSFIILAQGLTPVLMDVRFEADGTYAIASIAIMALFAVGIILFALLPPLADDRVGGRRASEAAVAA